MCLGLPAQVIEVSPAHPELVRVAVTGAERTINAGLLAGEQLATGDWVLVHSGFALERLTEEEAREATAALHDPWGPPLQDMEGVADASPG